MKRLEKFTYIILLDVAYHSTNTLYTINLEQTTKSFEKTVEFLHRCAANHILDKSIIVYANNWGRNQADIDVLQNEIRIYNQGIPANRHLFLEECYNIEEFKNLTYKYPPRRIFLTGGNLTGCMINESLPFNYFAFNNINSTTVVPELCFDVKDDLYQIWQVYQIHNIKISTLMDLEYFLFEQSIRNTGFLYTRLENDYEIHIKNKDLFTKRRPNSQS